MDLRIGEKIKRRRIEKGWTQEELAVSVGISTQAVSKWERENSYPDITLLPIIARSLDLTIDALMNFSLELPEKEIKKLVEKAVDNYVEKGFETGQNYVKEILKEYPNSISLKFNLGNLFQRFILEKDLLNKEKIESLYHESTKIYEEVLESGVAEFDYKTRVILIGNYTMLKEYDKAEVLIESLPDYSIDKNSFYANLYILKGEVEKSKEIQAENFKNLSNRLIQSLSLLSALEIESDKEKALEISRKSVEVSKLLGQSLFNALQVHVKILMENEKLEEAGKAFEDLAESIEETVKTIDASDRPDRIRSLLSKAILFDKDFDKIRDLDIVKLKESQLRKNI